jgi:hypothetical protein
MGRGRWRHTTINANESMHIHPPQMKTEQAVKALAYETARVMSRVTRSNIR